MYIYFFRMVFSPIIVAPAVWTMWFVYRWPDIRDDGIPEDIMIMDVKDIYYLYASIFFLTIAASLCFPATSIWALVALVRAHREQAR